MVSYVKYLRYVIMNTCINDLNKKALVSMISIRKELKDELYYR